MADEAEALELCKSGAFTDAAAWVLRAYGQEVLSFLFSLERAPQEAEEVFSDFCVALCQGLPRFRAECSLRTFAYALARRQWARSRRDRARRRIEAPLGAEVEAIAMQVRSSTAEHLRTGPRDRLAELRAALNEEDRTLLTLRLHRKLTWPDIARVLSDGEADSQELNRHAALLRKRYERLKAQFRRELRGGE
jgi:RNA polymerase sigma-70 factor, ECF subfamily